MKWLEKLRHARRVSVPLVAINTADPGATIRTVSKTLGSSNGEPVPIVTWDVCRGVMPVNETGREVARMTGEGEDDVTIGQPALFLQKAADYPANTIDGDKFSFGCVLNFLQSAEMRGDIASGFFADMLDSQGV